jgi:translation initiation factor 2-alpha kinase 4
VSVFRTYISTLFLLISSSQERQHQLAAEAEREAYLAAQLAEQFHAESTAQLQKQRQKHDDRNRHRHRAQSDATEVPQDGAEVVDMVVESFNNEMEFGGVMFNSVKIFHPKKGMFSLTFALPNMDDSIHLWYHLLECLGMTYLADPVCDDVHATLPLEVHIITFVSSYYATSQGIRLVIISITIC